MEQTLYALTRREIEILLLIAEGKKNSEIAGMLYISHRTVEAHKTHLCNKLNLRSTSELTCFASSKKEDLEKISELILD